MRLLSEGGCTLTATPYTGKLGASGAMAHLGVTFELAYFDVFVPLKLCPRARHSDLAACGVLLGSAAGNLHTDLSFTSSNSVTCMCSTVHPSGNSSYGCAVAWLLDVIAISNSNLVCVCRMLTAPCDACEQQPAQRGLQMRLHRHLGSVTATALCCTCWQAEWGQCQPLTAATCASASTTGTAPILKSVFHHWP